MSELPIWATILTSGAAGAVATVLVNRFIVGPRPDLRLSPSPLLVEDAERLTRENRADNTAITWQPLKWVLLTNHGDGTAHDIKLTGERCRPRVWVGDSAELPQLGQPVEASHAVWSNTVAAIPAGESVTVHVVMHNDASEEKPTVTATWPRLPGRGWTRAWALHRSVTFDFAKSRPVERGIPGQKELD